MNQLSRWRDQLDEHLRNRLLPFWLDHSPDRRYGGFITHFDRLGSDTGEDEKSLIAQARSLYAYSAAYRAGCGERCRDAADHAVSYLLSRMWDERFGGFFWMTNRRGAVTRDDKVLYGQSFAIYGLSEYTLATGNPIGRQYAELTFDLLQKHATDTLYGGYLEMFDREWNLAGPGRKGGDRKTLDAHMHLMEAYTSLYECTRSSLHRRKLLEDIELLMRRFLHPLHATGIPQFTVDWQPAPQIKFDIVWGWDRFKSDGVKPNLSDNTSYGHNVELAWLLAHALDVLGSNVEAYGPQIRTMLAHTLAHGIDWEEGGVYVEGSHEGDATDLEKEFWQQCEVMIGMADAYLRFGDERYIAAYEAVHRFLFGKGINPATGELWPLLTREGEPIWTHTSHSWKVNYHSIRAMIQCRARLGAAIAAGRSYAGRDAGGAPPGGACGSGGPAIDAGGRPGPKGAAGPRPESGGDRDPESGVEPEDHRG